MVYDYYKENNKKSYNMRIVFGAILIGLILVGITVAGIYLDLLELREIGDFYSIYIKDITYKVISSSVIFLIIFIVFSITSNFIRSNTVKFLGEDKTSKYFPRFLISFVIALAGAILTRDVFYFKIMEFMNSTKFGTTDPLLGKDIGYYVFERPLLMDLYNFLQVLWLFVIIYTLIVYFISLAATLTIDQSGSMRSFDLKFLKDPKFKKILLHNYINIAVFFIIKAFSYGFQKENLLLGNVIEARGAGYVDVNVWMKYYTIMPFVLPVIVAGALFFVLKGKLRWSGSVIAVYPLLWILCSVIAGGIQSFYVKPNVLAAEGQYLKYNIEKTKEAYGLNKIKDYDFADTKELTPEIMERNKDTRDNIRVVDYDSTLVSNVQMQSNTNFYTFNDGDIVNYNVNNNEIPVFITAREIDKTRLPEKSYENLTYRYTHGYGVVMNPINKLTPEGQVDFILSGLRMSSVDQNINVTQPRIYYGELTDNYVIVNAANNMNEIDYDGLNDYGYRYTGHGGVKLGFLERLLFAMKNSDGKMLISGYINSDSKILINRNVVKRVQKALPFLRIDRDPYIVITEEGELKWIVDGYTATSQYPYSQNYGDINYIRNSVKITVDAYDGTVEAYIVDKDPLIKTFNSMYPGILKDEPLPSYVTKHMKYPENLFNIQTQMLKAYHLDPENVSAFYTKQDLWDIAKYAQSKGGESVYVDSYYNMIKLPEGIGEKEELILMRPYTPSGELKHNMVSWLAVRNSIENYGEMILFKFPKNTNIFGPNQVEVKINQISEVSKNMTLWGQSGSDVYKGNLLVIPIENSVLYVVPIYIRAAGTSSTPEVKQIVVGYQKGEQFKAGLGSNLDEALNDLFKDIKRPEIEKPVKPDVNKPVEEKEPKESGEDTGEGYTEDSLIEDISKRYDDLKNELDELGKLIDRLKNK